MGGSWALGQQAAPIEVDIIIIYSLNELDQFIKEKQGECFHDQTKDNEFLTL